MSGETLTVGELCRRLRDVPDDYAVVIVHPDSGAFHSIRNIALVHERDKWKIWEMDEEGVFLDCELVTLPADVAQYEAE